MDAAALVVGSKARDLKQGVGLRRSQWTRAPPRGSSPPWSSSPANSLPRRLNSRDAIAWPWGLGSLECARRSAGRLKDLAELAEIEEIKKRRPS